MLRQRRREALFSLRLPEWGRPAPPPGEEIRNADLLALAQRLPVEQREVVNITKNDKENSAWCGERQSYNWDCDIPWSNRQGDWWACVTSCAGCGPGAF